MFMFGSRSVWAGFGGGTLLLGALLFASVSSASAHQQLSVQLRDDCDPATFNAAVGPGTCVRKGNTTFADFFAQLRQKHSVEGWRFNPDQAGLQVGDSLVATNRGGEEHTFTRVGAFGGSIVPPIEAAFGNPPPPPPAECGEAVRIPAGATTAPRVAGSSALPVGQNLFQCCIHPWMRTAITVKKS
jgi:hypothetical protein